jgi:tetratricopeptide (TPR) repeat protein
MKNALAQVFRVVVRLSIIDAGLAVLVPGHKEISMRLRQIANIHRKLSLVLALLIVVIGSCIISWSRNSLRLREVTESEQLAEETPLYLPSVRYVKLITLGFNHLFSDILWFNTLNYFGKQFEGNKDYRWLGHMCNLVTSLDSRSRHAYEFCTTLLSWISREPEASTKLLSRAIITEPDYWRYWYLRGFNYWYFLDRKDLAERDIRHASTLPGAPPFLASLASRLMVSKNDLDTAISFLKELIENTDDETARRAFEEKLKLAYISRDIRFLRKKIEKYEAKSERKLTEFSQLVESGVLKGIPLDPYNMRYYIDSETGEIKTRSGKKGLEFFGKTAKTGLARQFR